MTPNERSVRRRERDEVLAASVWEGIEEKIRVSAREALQAAREKSEASIREELAERIEEAKIELLASVEGQRFILDSGCDFAYCRDGEGNFTYVSPSVEAVTGYSSEEWSEHYQDYLTNNTLNEGLAEADEMLLCRGKTPPLYLAEFHRKDGSLLTLEINERPRSDGGKSSGLVGLARDVTERIKSENMLRQSQQALEDDVRARERNATALDEKQQRLKDEVAACTRDLVKARELQDKYKEELEEARDELRAQRREFEDARSELRSQEREPDGAQGSQDGARDELLAKERDLGEAQEQILTQKSELASAEEKLREQKREFDLVQDELLAKKQALDTAQDRLLAQESELESVREESDQTAGHSGSEYFSKMSQEIQISMNNIMEVSAMLSQTFLDAEQEKFVNTLWSSSSSLLSILNNILEISQIEGGTLKISTSSFEPRQMISELDQNLATEARAKDLSLHVEVASDCPQRVIGDEGRIRQVLMNFASNAIKYTRSGEIRISLDSQEESSGSARLRFSVADSGQGISEKECGRIFEMASPPAGPLTSGLQTASLGLPLSKKLVELMGGSIGVESCEGEGSTFFFELTLQVVERTAATIFSGE